MKNVLSFQPKAFKLNVWLDTKNLSFIERILKLKAFPSMLFESFNEWTFWNGSKQLKIFERILKKLRL